MKQKAKNENKSNNIRHLAAAVATSGLLLTILTACVSPLLAPPSPPVDVTIEITFLPKSATDPTLCADSVNLDNPKVYKNKLVKWQAVDSSGNINEGFDIYFDPFRGTRLPAPAGKVQRQIDPDAPTVQYKYTIWDRVTRGNPHVCDTLDPHFRVY